MAFLALLLAVLLLPRHRTAPAAALPPSPASPPPALAGSPENAAAASAPEQHPAEGPRGLPFVVTLSSAPTPADRADIAAAGARIRAYLPENAFLVEATPAARVALDDLSAFLAPLDPPPDVREALDHQRGKLSRPSARYADRALAAFAPDFASRVLALAKSPSPP